MRKITIAIAVFFIAFMASCSGSGPVAAVEALQEAACSGNAEEGMKYIDTDKFIDRMFDLMMENPSLANNPAAREMLEARKPQMKQQFEQQMKTTFSNSKDGPDCNSSVELVSEDGDVAKVSIETKDNGKKQTVELNKDEEGQWKVVFFDEIAEKIRGR
ncbi:MAG: hypothetical protein CMN76_02990 [Spirochaetaceae bacterium]|nr:hypothetical protein [Spirochaetaceae bacterium]|tara:strand:- start:30662 stop:31138 length:477 start_codon:yes stop_codon:yes gene_type:complete